MTAKTPALGGTGVQPAAQAKVERGHSHAAPAPLAVRSTVLLLSGGPDREHDVSLMSARGIADGLRAAGLDVHHHEIGHEIGRARTDVAGALASLPGDVIFPALHGSFGEGGPLQDLLEASGRPYVGCRPDAARLAMDKIATKLAASRAGVPTAPAAVLNPADDVCPIPFQTPTGRGVVLKPIHDGSSVGVHLVRSPEHWPAALAQVRADIGQSPGRAYMVESLVTPPLPGLRTRELTVGLLASSDDPDSLRALPVIEIRPATEFYDYDAKYIRDDTQYLVLPDTDPVVPLVQDMARRVAEAVGVRHLCRVDFLDPASSATGIPPQMLEINTMPGFTGHSLLPMAAARVGIPMPDLCRRLVDLALRSRAAL